MILGTYTLPWDPDTWTIPDPQQSILEQQAYASDFIFFYGEKIIGKRIDLEWIFMTQEEFNALDVLYQANLPIDWNLEEVSDPRTFTVEIEKLDGSLFDVALWDQPHRKDVKMSLIVLQATDLSLS